MDCHELKNRCSQRRTSHVDFGGTLNEIPHTASVVIAASRSAIAADTAAAAMVVVRRVAIAGWCCRRSASVRAGAASACWRSASSAVSGFVSKGNASRNLCQNMTYP